MSDPLEKLVGKGKVIANPEGNPNLDYIKRLPPGTIIRTKPCFSCGGKRIAFKEAVKKI